MKRPSITATFEDLPLDPEARREAFVEFFGQHVPAERFSADLVDRKNKRFPLRLLTTPLHRYDSNDSTVCRGGALFAFCQQTDPELLLLIEARKSDAGYRWEHASLGSLNWISTCTSTGERSCATSQPSRAAAEFTAPF